MKKVRVALLGCGNIANKHSIAARTIPEMEIVGLCDIRKEAFGELHAKGLSHLKKLPPTFTDAPAMYAKTKPDAVIICTPHTLHYDQCVTALDHDLHILVEKPMVTRLSDALDLEKRVERSGKVLSVGFNTPCTIEFQKLRDIVRSETYGKLRTVSMYLSQPWYQHTAGTWRQDPKLSGGGQLYDSGAHPLNSLTWTVESDIAEVHAFVDRLDRKVDINGTLNIRFANGVLASVAINGESPEGCFASFMFERGKVDIDPWMARWMKIEEWTGGYTARTIKYPEMPYKDSAPTPNFIDTILGRATPGTTARNGVIHSQLMDAIYDSARTGLPAKPPVAKPRVAAKRKRAA